MSTRGHTATCMTMVLSRSLSPPPLPFSLSHVHKGSQEYLQSPHMYSKHIQWRYRGISSLFAAEIGKVEVSNSSSAGYTRVDTTNLRHTASSDKLTIYSHVKCHNLTLECTPTWAILMLLTVVTMCLCDHSWLMRGDSESAGLQLKTWNHIHCSSVQLKSFGRAFSPALFIRLCSTTSDWNGSKNDRKV